MLLIGQQAPLDLEVLGESDAPTRLRDFLGKKVVLFFYPKDETPGCTIEACSFRDSFQELQEMGVVVIGVSADSQKSHKKFQEKHALPFLLLSDPGHDLMKAFHVFGEKQMFGKFFLGVKRSTFLLDESGKILSIWEDVKPTNHAQEILQFLKA